MTITIFGATGQVGLQVIKQALAKSYTVKAFGRNIEPLIDKDLHTTNFVAIKGYMFNEDDVYNAIKGSNVVVSCLGGGNDETDKTRSLGMKNIITQMQKLGVKKIISIGAIGVLNAADDTLIMDATDYPKEYLPVSLEHLSVLHLLEKSALDFTFICPPNILNKDFDDNYNATETYPPNPNKGVINAGNIADCILQIIEQNKFSKTKIGISNL